MYIYKMHTSKIFNKLGAQLSKIHLFVVLLLAGKSGGLPEWYFGPDNIIHAVKSGCCMYGVSCWLKVLTRSYLIL